MRKGRFLGWKGICSNDGKFVPADEGLTYVSQQLGIKLVNQDAPEADLLHEVVEWYFSGNWIEAYEEEWE